MLEIGSALVSDELIDEQFVCDLKRCKGACCVEGESGAPLDPGELKELEVLYPAVVPYLSPEGRQALETKGLYRVDRDGDHVTTLVGEKGACAYAVIKNGTAFCAIENAWRDGRIKFQKPLSCHLYPVRITAHKRFEAVNYHAWDICRAACTLGKALRMPVYLFVKDALIRKFGRRWFNALHAAALERNGKKKSAVHKYS